MCGFVAFRQCCNRISLEEKRCWRTKMELRSLQLVLMEKERRWSVGGSQGSLNIPSTEFAQSPYLSVFQELES